jgi:glycosyltransferase involved in cell wall biosynthesis
MKILFVNLSGLCFTVATPDTEPLGGTESSLCYLARHLAQRGHEVSVVTRAPPDTPDRIMGIRHVAPPVLLNADFIRANGFDAIIVNNRPLAGPPLRDMAPGAFLLLWNHVVPDQPVMRDLAQNMIHNSFDGIVYVSRWQQQITEQTFGFKRPAAVIGNGFAPAFENLFASANDLRAAKQNRAAYTTTPFRGLHILLDAMKGLETGTKLDLYSSMKVYQMTGGDDQYAPLYAYAAENPLITHHGSVAQKELAERLKPVAFFAYPSTYAETFCISAVEALASGLKVLTTATGALPEILENRADYVNVSPGEAAKLTADFRRLIEKNVAEFQADPTAWAEERFAALQEINRTGTWAKRAESWEQLLAARAFSP